MPSKTAPSRPGPSSTVSGSPVAVERTPGGEAHGVLVDLHRGDAALERDDLAEQPLLADARDLALRDGDVASRRNDGPRDGRQAAAEPLLRRGTAAHAGKIPRERARQRRFEAARAGGESCCRRSPGRPPCARHSLRPREGRPRRPRAAGMDRPRPAPRGIEQRRIRRRDRRCRNRLRAGSRGLRGRACPAARAAEPCRPLAPAVPARARPRARSSAPAPRAGRAGPRGPPGRAAARPRAAQRPDAPRGPGPAASCDSRPRAQRRISSSVERSRASISAAASSRRASTTDGGAAGEPHSGSPPAARARPARRGRRSSLRDRFGSEARGGCGDQEQARRPSPRAAASTSARVFGHPAREAREGETAHVVRGADDRDLHGRRPRIMMAMMRP